MVGQGAAKKIGERKGDFLAGKYLLEDCLGVGGMGEVYRATNVSLGRKVAIKLLSPEYVHIEDDVLRFLREARAAAAVRHPNVVDVFDVARDEDGTPFIVQELLAGEDLERYLASRKGRLSCAEALEIMIPVADAVAAAHAQSVVHRDLKPANIFLARDRNKITPKVLDFGACLFPTLGERSAKEIGMLIGTPHYMAPEQIVSKSEVDARSDVWALGVILYELIVGETPFEADNLKAVLQLVKTRDVPSLLDQVKDAPLELDVLIGRCTKRDRLARYKDAGALHSDMVAVRQSMRGPNVSPTRATIMERDGDAEPISGGDVSPPRSSGKTPKVGAMATPRIEELPRSSPKPRRLLTLNSPTSEPPPSADFGLELQLPSGEPAAVTAAWSPLDGALEVPPPLFSAPPASPPPASREPSPAPTPRSDSRAATPSSIPPVLDPRASRPAFSEPPPAVLAPPPPSAMASDEPLELMHSPQPSRAEESRPVRSSSASLPPLASPTPRSQATPSSPNMSRPASLSRASFASIPPPAPAAPPPLSAEAGAKLGVAIALPAIVGLVLVLAVPALGHPIGGALRGDSPLASGVLAVTTLVAAAALVARTVLGTNRSRAFYVASAGIVIFGIVMIIVTFAASEAAETGVPAAMGGISTLIAPIAPLALAARAGTRAREVWQDADARGEAIRSAVVASLLLFLALALSPVGAVRTRAPASAASPAAAAPAPAQS